jgi:hypothetical protein
LSLLTDNGPQFTAKFFQAVCAELGVKKVFTTAYHPQRNGQVERYNRTILSALLGYVARRQDDWDEYTSTLTYAYNCRVHSALGMPPFELALTSTPTTTSLQDMPRDEEMDPKTEKQAMLERLKTLRVRADGKLSAVQTRYKTDYDRGVTRKKNAQLREGDLVYVKVEVTEFDRSHKLYSPTPSSRTNYAVASLATDVSPPRADVRLRPNGKSDRLATAPPEPEMSPRGEYGSPVAPPGGPTPSHRMNNTETPRATESSSPLRISVHALIGNLAPHPEGRHQDVMVSGPRGLSARTSSGHPRSGNRPVRGKISQLSA